MKYKILGQSGLKVSQMCLGAMNWGSVTVGGSTDEEAKSCFDAFVSEFSSATVKRLLFV